MMPSAVVAEPTSKYARWNQKLNASWSSGDYARIGVTLQITGEELAEAANFKSGSNILDVAAGNGNASLMSDTCLNASTAAGTLLW